MKNKAFIAEVLADIDGMLQYMPTPEAQYADEELRLLWQYAHRLCDAAARYRNERGSEEFAEDDAEDVMSHHVGKSDYSKKAIQPWHLWSEYALNPWDADGVKRFLRTKAESGMDPVEARILDYEKIKHICDKRISDIRLGDPFYQKFVMPPWVKSHD